MYIADDIVNILGVQGFDDSWFRCLCQFTCIYKPYVDVCLIIEWCFAPCVKLIASCLYNARVALVADLIIIFIGSETAFADVLEM